MNNQLQHICGSIREISGYVCLMSAAVLTGKEEKMALKHKYSPRKIGTIVDSLHIFIGAAVTVMAVFAIFEPVKYMFLFPLIFLLAAVLSCVNSWYSFITYQRNRRKRAAGVVYLIAAIALALLFIVSAISIWGGN